MLLNLRKISKLQSKSNRLMSCLSMSTMCLLITASIVIITIISITPIIILSLGEINAGQRDLILSPQVEFMNSTKVQELSGQVVLPRLKVPVRVGGDSQGTAWFMDLNKQRQYHLGTIGGDQPIGHRNIYVHSSFQVEQNTQIVIKLQKPHFLQAIRQFIQSTPTLSLTQQHQMVQQIDKLSQIHLQSKFIVKQRFSDSMGKFPIGEINRFVYLDIDCAFQQMLDYTYHLHNFTTTSLFYNFIIHNPAFTLRDYSTQATINLPNRVQIYSSSDYERTYDELSSFGANVTAMIGLFSVKSAMPIASNLIVMGYFGMFIGVVLKLIIVSLFILSAIMMNNMLTMGVETKQFDMALFKTMGANKLFLIIYILINSLKYVLISNVIAFPFAYFILRSMTDLFQQFFGYKYEIYPTFGSIIGGLLIGILVPLVSSINPMRDIINNNLVEHLNPVRNKTQAIHTEIYVQGRQFPYGQLIFGLLATMFGLMIYYLLPKGLINQDITLLLLVFFIILQGLLIGMVLIGFSFQYILQKIIAYLLLFWTNKTDFILTLKNLSAHRFKNRRSSILYAFSVSFIVFVSVGIQIQIQTIYNELLKKHGSFVEIQGRNLDRQFYDDLLSKTQDVSDWAYQTIPLDTYLKLYQGVSKVMVSDQAKLYFAQNQIYGVSPNILSTWYADEISLDKTLSKKPYDPYSYLYTLDGHNTSTLSKYVARKFNILDGDNRQYLLSYYWPDRVLRIPLNYSTIFSKRAVLSYNAFSKRSQIGISMQKYRQLAGIGKYDDIPLNNLKIKITSPEKSSKVGSQLQRKMSNSNMDKLWQYSQLRTTIERIQNLLTNVLNILLVVVLVISLFSLITTSSINILNQSLQIGILLTLGYQKKRIVKIYIYQTFILVVNSCFIGIAVGWFVAWMMGLQRELFTDFNVDIAINGLHIIVIAAVVSSVLSTYQPLKQTLSKSISQVINSA